MGQLDLANKLALGKLWPETSLIYEWAVGLVGFLPELGVLQISHFLGAKRNECFYGN